MIKHIFRNMLDQGTLTFMDDIFVHTPEMSTQDKETLEVL